MIAIWVSSLTCCGLPGTVKWSYAESFLPPGWVSDSMFSFLWTREPAEKNVTRRWAHCVTWWAVDQILSDFRVQTVGTAQNKVGFILVSSHIPSEQNEKNIYYCQITHCTLGVDVGFDWIPILLHFLLWLHETCPFLIHNWSFKVGMF